MKTILRRIRPRILSAVVPLLTALFIVVAITPLFPEQDPAVQKEGSINSGKYTVVSEKSRIVAEVGTSGVFGFMGHGHTISPQAFTGEVTITSNEADPAAVQIRIDAKTLKETAKFDQNDREKIESQLHGEVLETAKYSEIVFQSKNVSYSKAGNNQFNVRMEGELSMHGITKSVTIPAKVTVEGDVLRATGTFKIERKDYNVNTQSAGGGTVKVANAVEVTFDIVAQR